jgi:phosphosulfolactate phosphohydrolase-like enzyme
MSPASAHGSSRAGLQIDAALVPSLVDAEPAARQRTVFIVVDVIRATTTLCVQMAQGCPRVYVAGGIEAARAAALAKGGERSGSGARPLLAGEVGGIAPPGFDCGNSPAEFGALDLAGREVVFATTNGTRALYACNGGAAILAGSLRNASAVARAAVILASRLAVSAAAVADERAFAQSSSQISPLRPSPGAPNDASEARPAGGEETRAAGAIVVVCSGRSRYPAYDDTICAGIILGRVQEALEQRGQTYRVGEGARIAEATAGYAQRIGLRAALAASDAGRAVESIGLVGDLDWCADIDACHIVPGVTGRDAQGDLLIVEPWRETA